MRYFVLLVILASVIDCAYSQNQYFTPNYQNSGSVYINPFSNPVCGPSACGYVLPTKTLNSYEQYSPSTYKVPTYGSSMSSLDIYRNMKSGSSYNTESIYTNYTPKYTPSSNSYGGSSSNWEIYRGGR